jgi:hypothetical protein
MRKIVLLAGFVMAIIGFLQLISCAFNYNSLTQYGKGYVWGSVLLLSTGLGFIYLGFKRKNTTSG